MEAKDTFEVLKKACLKVPVLVCANFDEPFLLETDGSKLRLGAVLSQTQTDSWYYLVAYARQSLTIHEQNHHSMKQEFLVLKWVIAEQFQEYLLWKPFIVRTNINLLTYIMTTSNLDATWHQWVELLDWFMFSIECQMGWDNVATDILSWITSKLDAETVKSIMDGVTMGMMERADAVDLVVAKADEEMHKPVQQTAILASDACISLHVTDWVTAQQEDPICKTAIEWISGQRVQDPKHPLGDHAKTKEGKTILQEWKKLLLYQGALYHCLTPTGELDEVLWFIAPRITE